MLPSMRPATAGAFCHGPRRAAAPIPADGGRATTSVHIGQSRAMLRALCCGLGRHADIGQAGPGLRLGAAGWSSRSGRHSGSSTTPGSSRRRPVKKASTSPRARGRNGVVVCCWKNPAAYPARRRQRTRRPAVVGQAVRLAQQLRAPAYQDLLDPQASARVGPDWWRTGTWAVDRRPRCGRSVCVGAQAARATCLGDSPILIFYSRSLCSRAYNSATQSPCLFMEG